MYRYYNAVFKIFNFDLHSMQIKIGLILYLFAGTCFQTRQSQFLS